MTKQQILQQVNPADIYLHYLHLDKIPAGNISSPFSEDKKPSFKLYQNGTYKCHSTGYQGDVFQFVADLHKLDCKKNFKSVINKIATDLNIIDASKTPLSKNKQNFPFPSPLGEGGRRPDEVTPPIPRSLSEVEVERGIGTVPVMADEAFKVETEDLKPLHFNYYHQFGVSPEILNSYGVQSVKKFQFWQESKNQIKKFPIFDGVIAFAYEVNGRYEIYIPEQKTPLSTRGEGQGVRKFFYNALTSDDIFGLQQLPDHCENIIISAGKKDCLVLNAHGYHAITFRSENHYPSNEQISLLQSKCDNLFICYDNDFTNPKNPGQEAQKKIIERFPSITPIYLPTGFKDVAEVYFKGSTINESFVTAQESIAAKEKQIEIENEGKRTIFHIAENYLSAHYKIRYNSIKLELQYSRIGGAPFYSADGRMLSGAEAWKKINENSLFIEMQKKGINISIDKLVSILKSDYTPEFNPVATYFRTLQTWSPSQPDYIKKLASFITCKDHEQFEIQFKK